jgi:lactate racemase
MTIGQGSTTETLSAGSVQELLARALEPMAIDGKRVLVIIPDGTRTAPTPLLFRLLYEQIGRRVARLDYLIALGTHQPMSGDGIDRLVGVTAAERAERYPNVDVFNHQWNEPGTLQTIGTISREETARLTDGLLVDEFPVTLNRQIFDYDQLVICGPVFPHEVVGFSGGAKYLFPGIAGADIINFTHWLGALVTSMDTIGVKDTPVRRVIHRAAEFVRVPILCLALVMEGPALHGMYVGPPEEAWSAAADLSAQLNVLTLPTPFAASCPCRRRSTTTSGQRPRRCTRPSRSSLTGARSSSTRPR